MSEHDFLEGLGDKAAAEGPSAVADIVRQAVIAVEKTELHRAFDDYDRIRRVRAAEDRRLAARA